MSFKKTFEVFKNKKHQVLEFDLQSNDATGFSYDDVKVNLFVDGKFVAEISDLLDKASVFIDAVDSIDWQEVAAEAV